MPKKDLIHEAVRNALVKDGIRSCADRFHREEKAMTLMIDLPPETQARLGEQAEKLGMTPEEAAGKLIKAVTSSPEGRELANLLVILLPAWVAKDQPLEPEVEQTLSDFLRPYVDRIRKEGNEEKIASLLPRMPDETLPPDQWEAEFTAWVERHKSLPLLPPQSYTREAFYGERG